jgi:uncharacterized protein
MIQEEVNKFLDDFLERLEKVGVNVSGLEMDHIAYKTSSVDEYDVMKPKFLKVGEQVHENMVRERRVGIFKLDQPLRYKNYSIPAVELIAPKPGEIIKSGWEHAEIVLKESYESFMDKYPNLNWDTSVMNSDLFSMIKLKLGEDMQAKFHLMPILEIIKQEKV